MLKQITASAAIEAEQGGKAVIVILTTPEHDRIKWVPLKSLLDGCIFLMDDAEPEAIKETPEEGSTPPRRRKAEKGEKGGCREDHGAPRCGLEQRQDCRGDAPAPGHGREIHKGKEGE